MAKKDGAFRRKAPLEHGGTKGKIATRLVHTTNVQFEAFFNC